MNQIQEMSKGDSNNGIETSTSTTSTNVNVTQSSSRISSSTNNGTNGTASTTGFKSPDNDSGLHMNINGSGLMSDDLKIISHLKDFKVINEQRRVLLNNTLSETSTEAKQEKETKTATTTQTGTSSTVLRDSNGASNTERVHFFNEKRTLVHEEHLDTISDLESLASASTSKFAAPALLRSPTTPPPKPPMLSRTRSIGVGDSRTSSVSTPPQSPSALRPQQEEQPPQPQPQPTSPVASTPPEQPAQPRPTSPTTSAQTEQPESTENTVISTRITATMIPEPVKLTTIQLKEDAPVLRRVQAPTVSINSESQVRQISPKHYEHLIEELKCPGCASPMKSPVLLCKTGHSICEQCTRVLMLCPLCKEPFTNIRSRTVEALCKKAHFRCSNAANGCTVRLQTDLLGWHEKQCVYKPMKCFMGRVWGDCEWTGREADWKEHLETDHASKVFAADTVDLIWNMGVKQRPLTGYYVFDVFGEMFNFYEVNDKERILFTMTCTSNVKEKKHVFAYEVTMIHPDNEALAITQKFPVHSEYDKDILLDGTCVSMSMNDLAKFIDEDRLLHYRVRVLEVKSPRKSRNSRVSMVNQGMHPIDFQQTQIEGSNFKSVPTEVIVTRKVPDIPYIDSASTPTSNGAPSYSSEDELERIRRRYNEKFARNRNSDSSDSDPEFQAFIAKKWGTPQLNFNRKYLKTNSSDSSSNDDTTNHKYDRDTLGKMDKKYQADDKISISSTSYKKRMTNTLRKSFRSLKSDLIEMRPFSKRSSPEKRSSLTDKQTDA